MDDSYVDTPKAAVTSAEQGEQPRKGRVFAAVLLGQLLSFLLALSGTISSLLVSKVSGSALSPLHMYLRCSCLVHVLLGQLAADQLRYMPIKSYSQAKIAVQRYLLLAGCLITSHTDCSQLCPTILSVWHSLAGQADPTCQLLDELCSCFPARCGGKFPCGGQICYLHMSLEALKWYCCFMHSSTSKMLQWTRLHKLTQRERSECMHLQVLAFRYTFLTSVQLLNSFTVPCVFIL